MRTFVSLSFAAMSVTAKKPLWNELEGYTFDHYLVDHGKAYRTQREVAQRKANFEKNLQKIRAVNAEPKATWRAGVNRFTDWSEEELKNYNKAKYQTHDMEKDFDKVHRNPEVGAPPLPQSIDWRETNAVGPIRDQGQCGSCWAHSVAETISSQYNILTNTTTVLSVGQVVDCLSGGQIGNGCAGGYPYAAMKSLKLKAQNNEGPMIQQSLTEEWAFPYTAENYFWDLNSQTKDTNCTTKICHTQCKDISQYWAGSPRVPTLNAAGVSGVGAADSNHPTGGPAAMKALVDVGPLSILVAAVDWFMYESGVFQNTAAHGVKAEWIVDHAVQMVGYGYDKEVDENYWIVRNTWSTQWGEAGYIRLKRAKANEAEPCSPEFQDGSQEIQFCGTSSVLFGVVYPMVYHANITTA